MHTKLIKILTTNSMGFSISLDIKANTTPTKLAILNPNNIRDNTRSEIMLIHSPKSVVLRQKDFF